MAIARYAGAKLAVERGYYVKRDGTIIGSRGVPIKGDVHNGYLAFGVKVSKNKTRRIMAHHVVAFLKYGALLLKTHLDIRHLDGDKLNCSWKNILMGTKSVNSMDRPTEQRRAAALRAASANRKVSSETAEAMRSDYAKGMSLGKIMSKYKTRKTSTWYILSNKTYRS